MDLRKAQWEKRLQCSENHKNLELARTKQTWSWDKAKTGTYCIRILEEIRVCSLSILYFKSTKCLPYAKHLCLSVIQEVNKAGIGAALLNLHLSKITQHQERNETEYGQCSDSSKVLRQRQGH